VETSCSLLAPAAVTVKPADSVTAPGSSTTLPAPVVVNAGVTSLIRVVLSACHWSTVTPAIVMPVTSSRSVPVMWWTVPPVMTPVAGVMPEMAIAMSASLSRAGESSACWR